MKIRILLKNLCDITSKDAKSVNGEAPCNLGPIRLAPQNRRAAMQVTLHSTFGR